MTQTNGITASELFEGFTQHCLVGWELAWGTCLLPCRLGDSEGPPVSTHRELKNLLSLLAIARGGTKVGSHCSSVFVGDANLALLRASTQVLRCWDFKSGASTYRAQVVVDLESISPA